MNELAEYTTQAVSAEEIDRKSTRLNSSHDQISYAVFCLKKKKKQRKRGKRTARCERSEQPHPYHSVPRIAADPADVQQGSTGPRNGRGQGYAAVGRYDT